MNIFKRVKRCKPHPHYVPLPDGEGRFLPFKGTIKVGMGSESATINAVLCIILIFTALLLSFPSYSHAANGFWVYDGVSTYWVEGDPDDYKAKEWQIRLYKKSQAAGQGRWWGLTTGKYASAVMKELKGSQAFERKYEKWCGCDWGESTFFNPQGPIAVVEKRPTKSQQLLGKATELYERIKTIRKLYYDTKGENPFIGVSPGLGDVIYGYGKNFEDVYRKQALLRQIMEDVGQFSEREIMRKLDELLAEINKLDQSAKKINASLTPTGRSAPTAGPKFVGLTDQCVKQLPSWTDSCNRAVDEIVAYYDTASESDKNCILEWRRYQKCYERYAFDSNFTPSSQCYQRPACTPAR